MEIIRQATKIIIDTYKEDTEDGDYVNITTEEDRGAMNIYIGIDEVERVYGFNISYISGTSKQGKRLCIKLYNWMEYDMGDKSQLPIPLKSLYIDPLDADFEDNVEKCSRTLYLLIDKNCKENKVCRVVLDNPFYIKRFDELIRLKEEVDDIRKLLPEELKNSNDIKQLRNVVIYMKEQFKVCKK